jgi:hypothetical protein
MKNGIGNILIILIGTFVSAQELTPRIMAMAPVGTNIAIANTTYSYGNVLVDPSLPIDGPNASLFIFGAGYQRTLNIFNKLTKVDAFIPYATGNWQGELNQEDRIVYRSGMADPLFRIHMHLIGGPALSPEEFATFNSKKFKLGAQFRFQAPLGQYDPNKLINIGTNRWSFKVGVGASYKFKKFTLESYINALFFTTNKDFFDGNELQQKPMGIFQLHGIYFIKKGFWVSGSIGWTRFGGLLINDEITQDEQRNIRLALHISYTFKKGHGLNLSYNNGTFTRYGADFNSVGLTYHYLWLDKFKKK